MNYLDVKISSYKVCGEYRLRMTHIPTGLTIEMPEDDDGNCNRMACFMKLKNMVESG